MTKDEVVRGAIALIRRIADEKELDIADYGTGHAYDRTIWKGLVEDVSNIPNIVARNDDYSIELRSFWGNPEVDIYRKTGGGEEILVLNYADTVKRDDKYIHTEDFRVHEVRVDARWNYKACIEEIYEMIDFIEANTTGRSVK